MSAHFFHYLPHLFARRHAFGVLKQVHLKKIGHPLPFLRDGICIALTTNAFLLFCNTSLLFGETLLFLAFLF